ncbi:unnamed protein product [Trichobilharzia szidati]|nr:unnamed protein product [Trichobilharzia szidati]
MLSVLRDRKFQQRIDQIAEKYSHEFSHCDIVVLSDFSIVEKGDFLSLLPDDTELDDLIVDQEVNIDDVNDEDSDIESVILSSVHMKIGNGNNSNNKKENNNNTNNCNNTDIDTDTTSSLHENIVHGINEESEDEDKTVEEEGEEDNSTTSDVEIPMNRGYHHDYRYYSNHDDEKNSNGIKAALSLLEKSVSSWEKRRNRSMDASTTFTSSDSRKYSLTNYSEDTNSRNTLLQIKSKMNNRRYRRHHRNYNNHSYPYTKRLHMRRQQSPVLSVSSTSKERVIQWLIDQQLYLSQLIH